MFGIFDINSSSRIFLAIVPLPWEYCGQYTPVQTIFFREKNVAVKLKIWISTLVYVHLFNYQ